MNKQEWMQLYEKIRKPGFILFLVVLAGFLVNLSIFMYLLLPKLQQKLNTYTRFSQIERQLQNVEKLPIPAKINMKDVETLVKQTPMKENISHYLLSLKEAEQQAGVSITAVTFGEDKENKKKLEELALQLSNQAGTKQPATAQQNSTNAAAATGAAPATNTGTTNGTFLESRINITSVGTYPQIVDFMNKLYQLDRISNMIDWQLEPSGAVEKQADAKVQAKISIIIYSAPQYEGKFQDVPAIDVSPFEPKPNPMESEYQYLKTLEGEKR
jgi:Tfp pilus assembly protein PilO